MKFAPDEHRWIASCALGARESWSRSLLAGAAEGDWVELRLDGLGSADRALWLGGPEAGDFQRSWAKQLRNCGRPVLLTLRDRTSFGGFEGGALDQAHFLIELAQAGWPVAAIDVDVKLLEDGATCGILGPWPESLTRVISEHGEFVDAVHTGRRMSALLAAAAPGDLAKLALTVTDARDGLRLLRAVRAVAGDSQKAWTAFAVGPRGSATRLLSASLGAGASFGPPSGSPATAPGQQSLLDARRALQGCSARGSWPFAGVLGSNLKGSQSPALHGAALSRSGAGAAGRNAGELWIDPPANASAYLSFESDDPDGLLEELDHLGLRGRWRGWSVTAPHKAWAAARADESDAPAREAGAANTLRPAESGGLEAWNTDVLAVQEWLAVTRPPAGPVLVLGAGGAARAAILAARGLGLEVHVWSRRPEAADSLAAEAGVHGAGEQLPPGPFAVVIHTTPLGGSSAPGGCPSLPALKPGAVVIDAAYGAGKPPLAKRAAELSARYVPGEGWLTVQASRQFEGFFPAAAHALASAGGIVGRPGPAAREGARPDADPRPIVLLGLRGAGKTTLAPHLAARLGRPWFDADEVLVRRARREPHRDTRTTGGHQPAPRHAGEVLERWGVDLFRDLEQQLWSEWLFRGGSPVIAAGGGAVESELTRHLLGRAARCVWLDVEPEIAAQRVSGQAAGERPRLAGDDALSEALALSQRRAPWFAELAAVRLTGLRRAPETLADELAEQLAAPADS